MKRKGFHKSKPVGDQGSSLSKTSLSSDDKNISMGKDVQGHHSRSKAVLPRNPNTPQESRENNVRIARRDHQYIIKWISETCQQEQRPPR